MDGYLKLKTKQAEITARLECKDKGDKVISERMQLLLSNVRKMEDYARDLSKEMSNLPPEADLKKEMRKEYLEYIMKEKFYSASIEQFNEWPLIALKHEVNRIERIKKDPGMRRTAPNWSKYKEAIDALTLEYKRKKQELVDAKFGTEKAIAKWTRQYTDEAYGRLEERRKKDPKLPKRPDYKKADEKQVSHLKPIFTSSETSTIVLNQKKRQKQMDVESATDKAREDDYMKEALKRFIEENTDPATTAPAVINRPPSPNSSEIKTLPRNPLGSKILKWSSDKQTHVLTLLRSNGEVKYTSRETALGLSIEDLQDLLELQLNRDEDDESSLEFEMQFKGQVRELLMRQ